MDNAVVNRINRSIAKQYGHDWLRRPIFRIVWSDKQIEVRLGAHEIFYGSIYLRTDYGVHTVPKYTWIKERWILERLFPNNAAVTGIEADHTYEPLYVFQDKNGNYLPPILRAANLVCWSALNPTVKHRDFNTEMLEQIAKDAVQIEEYLESESPYIATMLHNREAVTVA